MKEKKGTSARPSSCAGELREQIYLAAVSSPHYFPFMDRDKLT